MLACGSLFAQRNAETVYLKNGSIVRGEIVEQVPGQSLKIKTRDGSIFVYQMSEVEKIAREAASERTQSTGHRGLDFNVDLGYDFGKGGSGCFDGEISLGKRFSKNFYWGVGAGVRAGNGDPVIPIFTDFKVYFPLQHSTIAPMGTIKLGYAINTADDFTVGTGRYKTTVEMPNYIILGLMPGLQVPLSGKVDFNFGLGFLYNIATSGGNGGAAGAIKAGFSFHKPLAKKQRRVVPTRDKGLQLTVEADLVNPWAIGGGDEKEAPFASLGPKFTLSYKFNPQLSLGVGYGISCFRTDFERKTQYYDSYDEIFGGVHKIYLRGQYRLTDRKLSPFAMVDLGVRKYKIEDPEFIYADYGASDGPMPKKAGLFVQPAIGASLRTTNNSYLELKIGYDISGKFGKQEYNNVEFGAAPGSGFSIGLGWTHTFGSKRVDKLMPTL